MLDAFIIEQLRRERDRRRWEPVPLELPLPPPDWPGRRDHGEDDGGCDDRGGVIIEPDGSIAAL